MNGNGWRVRVSRVSLRRFAQVLLLLFTISVPVVTAYVYESSSLGVTQTIRHVVVNASYVTPSGGNLPPPQMDSIKPYPNSNISIATSFVFIPIKLRIFGNIVLI